MKVYLASVWVCGYIILLRVVRVMNHGMYRAMVVGIWIYSMVCDIREYQGESDGIWLYRDSEGIWYYIDKDEWWL